MLFLSVCLKASFPSSPLLWVCILFLLAWLLLLFKQ